MIHLLGRKYVCFINFAYSPGHCVKGAINHAGRSDVIRVWREISPKPATLFLTGSALEKGPFQHHIQAQLTVTFFKSTT